MFTVDLSIVNIALPTLVRELHADFATVQWVVVSYLLVLAALMLAAARLGDLVGRRRLFLLGLALFTAASALCGLAPGVGWLIAFRSLQGVGAVLTSALGVALVTAVFPDRQRGRALGVVGGIIALGVALGPSLGGVLITVSSWRAIFWVNVPIGLASMAIVQRVVPAAGSEEEAAAGGARGWRRLDPLGTVLVALVLGGFALGMHLAQRSGFGSPRTWGPLALALVGLPIFLRVEARNPSPMLDLELFRRRSLSVSLGLAVVAFVVMAGSLFLMPFFLELVLGFAPLQVGLLLAVTPVLGGLVSPISGWLADRYQTRLVSLAGLVAMSAGCWLISTFDAQLSAWRYVVSYAPFGIGIGLFQSPNNSAVMGAVPAGRLGTGSGLLSLSRTLGQTAGLPLMATLFSAIASGHAGGGPGARIEQLPPAALVAGVDGTFQVGGALLLAAAAAAWWIWRDSGDGDKESESGR